MTKYQITNGNNTKTYSSKRKAQDAAEALPGEIDVEPVETDGGTDTMGKDGKVEKPVNHAEVVETSPEPDTVPDTDSLAQNPIQFLTDVNSDFVNTIKGKPAISKQGFRFIQREFEITTESEVVQWVDDPMGCVVWAKATLSDGYSAEAHGEAYQSESDVSDNEMVRYADTRAKNRAISDLTASGSLAVEELTGGE